MPFIDPYRYERHYSSKMLAYAFIIVTNQRAKQYETTIVNMPMETNKVVVMCCKIITANFLTVLGLLVEPITSIAKTKANLQAYLSISQTP